MCSSFPLHASGDRAEAIETIDCNIAIGLEVESGVFSATCRHNASQWQQHLVCCTHRIAGDCIISLPLAHLHKLFVNHGTVRSHAG